MKVVTPDRNRVERCGIPEVVYAEGKSFEDTLLIVRDFLRNSGRAIVTRISEKDARKIVSSIRKKNVVYSINPRGRTLLVKRKDFAPGHREKLGVVGVITAGTSDIPVAEEAKEIAEELGLKVLTEYDVGVAGIHRLYPALEKMKEAEVLIVTAGMDGALPSVVSGLVDVPVIGVPTSVGYGTGAGGKAALHTMLNACAPVAVVNIDNGFGASVIALKILRGKRRRRKRWQA